MKVASISAAKLENTIADFNRISITPIGGIIFGIRNLEHTQFPIPKLTVHVTIISSNVYHCYDTLHKTKFVSLLIIIIFGIEITLSTFIRTIVHFSLSYFFSGERTICYVQPKSGVRQRPPWRNCEPS